MSLPALECGRASTLSSEKKPKGEEKANRDNPKFKNRCNPMILRHILFSNRDKNAISASPQFRPTPGKSRRTGNRNYLGCDMISGFPSAQ